MADERQEELLKEGDKFGDYTVVRLLGKGGMGAVYLMQGASGSQYAVKIMFPEKVSHEMRRRFAKEADFAIKIRHKNLVSVYDVGEDPETGLCYMIMDYVPGGTLSDRLKEKGRFSIQEAVPIVSQIAAALDVAHRHGLVHRDIKPDNIMFDADGTPRLSDLGVAKFDDAQQSMVTTTGMVIGTPAYMAPEQMLNSHAIDARADIYSLGVVLYEMLSGKRPNEGRTAIELMAKAIKGEPLPDIKTMCPELSVAVSHVVSLLCAPKPEERPQTALGAADLLHKAASGKLVLLKKKPQSSTAEAAALRAKRSKLIKGLAIGVGVAAFLFVGIAGWIKALNRSDSAKPAAGIPVTNVLERVAVVTNVVERVAVVTNVVENTVVNEVEKTVANAVKSGNRNKASGNSRRRDNSLHQTELNGFTWTYRIAGEGAVLSSAHFQALLSSPCVSPAPSNVLKIPSRLDGIPVVEIGRFAFNKCTEITEIYVPEGVLQMSYGAFCRCQRLERVVLPSTLRGDFAESFKYCPRVSRIEFARENPNYVIDKGVVYSRDKTKLVMMPRAGIGAFEIPETVREIAPYAFDGTPIKFMNIPAGVRKIGGGAFFGCSELAEVVFNAPLEYMGTCVFGYSGLKRIAFPSGTKSIPSETFRGCSQLAVVSLPETLERIEGHATFEGCSALEELHLPHGLRKLGESQLFGACSSLKRLIVPASVESMSGDSGTFRRCSQLREIVFEGNAPALTGSSKRGQMFEGAPKGVRVVVRKGTTGWSNDGDQSLPRTWPADAGKNARPIVCSREDAVQEPITPDGDGACELKGPYGLVIKAGPGCGVAAKNLLADLEGIWLPAALKFYGDPYQGKKPEQAFVVTIERDKGYAYRPGLNGWKCYIPSGRDRFRMSSDYMCSAILTRVSEPVWTDFAFYVNRFLSDAVRGGSTAEKKILDDITIGKEAEGKTRDDYSFLGKWQWAKQMKRRWKLWVALEEVRARDKDFILKYCNLKNQRYAAGKGEKKITWRQMAELMGEAVGFDVVEIFRRNGVEMSNSSGARPIND